MRSSKRQNISNHPGRISSGFTVIELLIVAVIIATLATTVIIGVSNARSRSRDARRVADTKQIATALGLFYEDRGHFPDGSTGEITHTAPGSGGQNHCAHDIYGTDVQEWALFQVTLSSYMPVLPPYDGIIGKRYCSGAWSGFPGKTVHNYQLVTGLENPSGNGDQFTGAAKWNNEPLIYNSLRYVIQK